MNTIPVHRSAALALAPALALLMLTLAPPLAQAQLQSNPDEPYGFVGQSATHDTNVFRTANGGKRVADTVLTTTAGAGAQLSLGRQRLSATGQLGLNRYQQQLQLDHTSQGLNLALDWATAERVSGRVAHTRQSGLAPYGADNTTATTRRNILRQQQTDAEARVGLSTPLSFEAGAQARSQDYSAPEYAAQQQRQRHVRAGVRLQTSPKLDIGLGLRVTQGNYPEFTRTSVGSFLADRYRRRDVDLSANWAPTGQSTVAVRASYGRQTNYEARSFEQSGLTGSLAWAYRPTGKLSFNTSLSRDTGADASFNSLSQSAGAAVTGSTGGTSSSGSASGTVAANLAGQGLQTSTADRITNSFALAATYEATGKLQLSSSVSVLRRDLSNTNLITSAAGSPVATAGSDTTRRVALSARYRATRNVQLDCGLASELRKSDTALSYAYKAGSTGCSAYVRLQ